ncbi:NRDE family protein [Thalassospiraceae bacterium LMO-SO8]|nr:NRDE family protein [Alphaproteobacteria bacterium LMO-S08]WND74495.1 NRDE family protein [Thalassospiraceae bacterium LMO-SO8]
MCTLVILRRPGHDWPLIVAANRDEMADRLSDPPGRHWPDAPHVTAGRDRTAGGTWLGVNDDRMVAGVLNRHGSLGQEAGKRSRGELPLEALSHGEAEAAAEALAHLDGSAYRSFNLIVADVNRAFWISGNGTNPKVSAQEIDPGLSMITAHDLNDDASARIGRYRPLFEAAPPPEPAKGAEGWDAWVALMSEFKEWRGGSERDSMAFTTDFGFQTVSSSLIALPKPFDPALKPQWLFCPERPRPGGFRPITN